MGTAGHVDHGKSALVRALTGIEPDRLEEERRRGISIDLGFAHLDLTSDLRLGFVDVPGHERFVKNMLAGAGGIDVLLLVIAADESIKPQTREHFEICRLLGIRHGLIVLTKADLVDSDILDLVRLEVEELVSGSFLQGAPIVPVSSLTGLGLNMLRENLVSVTKKVPPKDSSSHFRLPIDRVFSLRGFGTVVTGTLIAGSVSVEDEVEIYPGGTCVRVRGIHVHGAPVGRALAGQRTALNLAGVEPSEIERGCTLAPPGMFRTTTRCDVRLELLGSANPLKNRAPVHFHSGTAEIVAEARLFDKGERLAPGQSAYVRLNLKEPALLLPGDRFIVRMFSPVVTIGGGTVLDIAPPPKRKGRPGRLEVLDTGSVADRIRLILSESVHGADLDALIARTGLTAAAIERETSGPDFLRTPAPHVWIALREWWDSTVQRVESSVAEFHRRHPLQPGMAKEELRSREFSGAPAFLADALLRSSKLLVSDAEHVRLRSHKLDLKDDEAQALHKIEQAFRDAGLAVPSTREVLAASGVEPGRARSLLQILLRQKKLVRLSEDLTYHQTAIDSLRALLGARRGERFGVPLFKEWTGVSRKYAIPLLEFLDRERVTRRDGDERVVL